MKGLVGVLSVGVLVTVLTVQGAAAQCQPSGPAQVSFAGLGLDGNQQPGAEFSTAGLRDLFVVVDWQTLVGAHSQRLELNTPDGSIYQRHTMAVEGVDGQAHTETRVPVRGTWITEYSLHGTWPVKVYLDGAATPIATGCVVLTP